MYFLHENCLTVTDTKNNKFSGLTLYQVQLTVITVPFGDWLCFCVINDVHILVMIILIHTNICEYLCLLAHVFHQYLQNMQY